MSDTQKDHVNFGKLRSILHAERIESHAEVWSLICEYKQGNPTAYFETWLPYLTQFSHLFTNPLSTVSCLVEVDDFLATAPFATFTFEFCEPVTREMLVKLAEHQGAHLLAGLSIRPGLLQKSEVASFINLLDEFENIVFLNLQKQSLGPGHISKLLEKKPFKS